MAKKMKNLPSLRCKGKSCVLLAKGTKVRVLKEQSEDIATGKRLKGTRAADIRLNPKVQKIAKITLKPGQPPMYKVTNINNALFTREQLQVVNKKEKKVDQSKRKWVIEKILRKKKTKDGRLFYEIKWKNFEETTDEPVGIIEEDVPEMAKKFEEKFAKENKRLVMKKLNK